MLPEPNREVHPSKARVGRLRKGEFMIQKVKVSEDCEVAIEMLRVVNATEVFNGLAALRGEIIGQSHDYASGATTSHLPTRNWLIEWIDDELSEVDGGFIDESEATGQLLPLRSRLAQLPDDVLIDLEC